MIRDSRRDKAYWDEWTTFLEDSIRKAWERLKQPPGDPNYRPQYVFELANDHYELMLRRYSRGDPVSELSQYFPGLLKAWEESERLGKDVWSDEIQYTRHAWAVNIDHYVRCFWLTGLALTLDIPDEQWQRLLALMGNEGEDALLDRVIASRQPGRPIGDKLRFPKAYQRLLDVVEAPAGQRPQLLRNYLDSWFSSLKNAGSPSFPKDYRTPYWWDFCTDEAVGMKGGYFGCWCIEAVAVAKALTIDDSLCLDHPNYPGDLIQDDRGPRYTDPTLSLESNTKRIEPSRAATQPRSRSWLSRFLLGSDK